MSDTVKRVAWTFAQAFLATLVVLLPGILNAPNPSEARALATAAMIAAFAAAFSAVKNMMLKPGEPGR